MPHPTGGSLLCVSGTMIPETIGQSRMVLWCPTQRVGRPPHLALVNRIKSVIFISKQKGGIMRVVLISVFLIILTSYLYGQETSDGRWLDEETWQPRNQHATIDNSPGSGGGWPVVTDWGDDVRLTYFDDPRAHNPEIAVYGDNVYVAWFKLYENKIFFLRSANGGGAWYENVQISDDSTYNAVIPQISAWGDNVYVVYRAWRPYQGIYLKRSTDRGATWQETQSLYYTARNYGGVPVVTSSNNNVYVVFRIAVDLVPPGNADYYMVKSSDFGVSWSDTMFVSDTIASGLGPDLSLNNEGLHLIRGKNLSSSVTEILYNRSTDEGESWEGPYLLSHYDTSGSFWPQIAAWGNSNVIVSWTDYKYSPYAWTGDAFICRSTDNGQTWTQPIQMTDPHLVESTDVSANGDTVLLVYSDFRYGHPEIMANVSYDGGRTWVGEERLTEAPGYSIEPSCELGNGIGHVTWSDARNNPDITIYEVYYKRGDLQTGVSDTLRVLPSSDRIVSSYPNPFNSSTTIAVNYSKGGDVGIGIYDIQGRLIKELQARNFQGGDKKAVWDATNISGQRVSSGIYFVRVETPQTVKVKKLLYLR